MLSSFFIARFSHFIYFFSHNQHGERSKSELLLVDEIQQWSRQVLKENMKLTNCDKVCQVDFTKNDQPDNNKLTVNQLRIHDQSFVNNRDVDLESHRTFVLDPYNEQIQTNESDEEKFGPATYITTSPSQALLSTMGKERKYSSSSSHKLDKNITTTSMARQLSTFLSPEVVEMACQTSQSYVNTSRSNNNISRIPRPKKRITHQERFDTAFDNESGVLVLSVNEDNYQMPYYPERKIGVACPPAGNVTIVNVNSNDMEFEEAKLTRQKKQSSCQLRRVHSKKVLEYFFHFYMHGFIYLRFL